MVEERITTVETPAGRPDPAQAGPATVHHTTVITDGERRRGSPGWLVGIIMLLALVAGIYFFSGMSQSESAKDNAVADAAGDVGEAANKAGAAAEQVGEAARDAVDRD